MSKSGILFTHTRPPLCHETTSWQNCGFRIYYQPLLKVVYLPVAPLPIQPQAIVLSSANGAAALQNSVWDRHIPVYTVGAITAEAAKAAGFINCIAPNPAPHPSALDLVQWLVKNLQPTDGAIVHGSGEKLRYDVTAMLSSHSFETLRVVLYHTQSAKAFAPEIAQSLQSGLIQKVVVASEQALQTLAGLLQKIRIAPDKLQLLLPSAYLQSAAAKLGFVDSLKIIN